MTQIRDTFKGEGELDFVIMMVVMFIVGIGGLILH